MSKAENQEDTEGIRSQCCTSYCERPTPEPATTCHRRRLSALAEVLAFLGVVSTVRQARAQTELPIGETSYRVIEDDPLAKQISVSFSLGFFGYRDYFTGGWGMDLTYFSRYFFAISSKVHVCPRTSSSNDDQGTTPFYRKIAPFYDVTGYIHLWDKVGPSYPDVRISGGFFSRAVFLMHVPARMRQTFSLRGGLFSLGTISPMAFAGLSTMASEYLTTSIQSINENRTLFSNLILYLDALFPTTPAPSTGFKDRVGGRLGLEMRARNVKSLWNGWMGFDVGYLRSGFIGRFLIGLTI